VANRTNEVMKVLTIYGTLALPLVVITGFFGMNLHLPWSNNPHGCGMPAHSCLLQLWPCFGISSGSGGSDVLDVYRVLCQEIGLNSPLLLFFLARLANWAALQTMNQPFPSRPTAASRIHAEAERTLVRITSLEAPGH
jgi:hypothetical protein